MQACVLQDLLARPQLAKNSKSTRTCIIPASKGRLVFLLKYHAHTTVPQIDTSSLQLTGTLPCVSNCCPCVSCLLMASHACVVDMPLPSVHHEYAMCVGFGPVTSTAAFSYNRGTGALTVTFNPASVAHRCAQQDPFSRACCNCHFMASPGPGTALLRNAFLDTSAM